ncbi:MAG: agmatine deiminase family protein [Deltaproteobacteria bacterium]
MDKIAPNKTPRELGYRMPAEWERHEATWLGWPHNKSDWPGKFTPIAWVYGEMARKIAPEELVRILVNSEAHEGQARRHLARAGVDLSKVRFFRFRTNRGWTRDFGPIFIKKSSDIAVAGFRFNAWAKYDDWDKDAQIHEKAANSLGIQVFRPQVHGRAIVLEGGAIDVNGRGALITTEECLLDDKIQVRNPGLGKLEIERALRDYLGAANVLWLGRGIAGDDTHGHVDDLCRFVNATTVALCREENPHDANYRPLRENRERLEDMRLEDGGKIEVIELPMPEPLYFNGQRLPASYANFYISNNAVLVPTFNDPSDREALGILGEIFRNRQVVGIHAVDLVWGLGALHCLTREQPAK